MSKRKWGDVIQTKTASETVYDILHRNIINLNLIPGTIMSEKEISEKMKLSRTPVREAFIRLSKEALVTVVPQKGSFVSRINLARVKEERFLRESLETSVLEELILNKDPLFLDDFHLNLEKQKIALDSGESNRFMELDDQFHSMFFDLVDRPMCFEVIMSFSSHYRRVRYLSMAVSGVSDENLKHHRELIHLIGNRDLEGAQEIMKVHLRKLNIEKNIIYQKFPDYFKDTPSAGGLDLMDEKLLFQGMNR
ncbi:GntR family transcriptional regulator [Oceanispirochaeta crateris]|uniref:GntR family transcriptional regulator n=1 Tax=Oceanispirochaeta crateris TaxID=2518645 RepID=A0A5C1QNC0_9SPIO|nr:GntR family transcriptional regulator [Oceanispirochaeta crateris]QEN09595.1 GntR family transcriptional regulator [Oceanispirochaeta crateris]